MKTGLFAWSRVWPVASVLALAALGGAFWYSLHCQVMLEAALDEIRFVDKCHDLQRTATTLEQLRVGRSDELEQQLVLRLRDNRAAMKQMAAEASDEARPLANSLVTIFDAHLTRHDLKEFAVSTVRHGVSLR